MKTRWTVVADAARARMLATSAGGDLKEVETLVHPESRLHTGEILSGSRGRQAATGVGSHQMEGKTDPKETEAISFARQIADRLKSAKNAGTFDELVLVAPPHFLGLLRGHLDAGTQALVIHSVDKDLVQADLATLAESVNPPS